MFDDRSAPTTITETVFGQARQAYLALPADQEPAAGSHVEPPPKVRNKPQSQRSNHDQQPTATAATTTTR